MRPCWFKLGKQYTRTPALSHRCQPMCNCPAVQSSYANPLRQGRFCRPTLGQRAQLGCDTEGHQALVALIEQLFKRLFLQAIKL
jgi:hypothetical protein